MREDDLRTVLGIQELPVGSSEPRTVPPEGIILGRRDPDGWTRRYLLRPALGRGGQPRRIVLSEVPPAPGEAPAPAAPPRMAGPASTMVVPKVVPLFGASKGLGQAFPIGGTLPAGSPKVPPAYPGEYTGAGPAPAGAKPPEEIPPVCPDGPVQLADGSFLDPEDPVTFANLCELIPALYDALLLQQQAIARGAVPGPKTGAVTVVGGIRSAGAVPGAMSPFGQAGGAMGGMGGGGGFGFMGGGGAGPQGARGPQGAVGFGGLLDQVVKTDGDFSVGPGSFVVVPGTLITFTSGAGPALFLLQGTAGNSFSTSGDSQSGQIGFRIDGVDYPVATRLLHTFVGGVGEFMLPLVLAYPVTLTAGTHTVEVIARGLGAGEFSGTGLGTSFGLCAVASVPLIVAVSHN